MDRFVDSPHYVGLGTWLRRCRQFSASAVGCRGGGADRPASSGTTSSPLASSAREWQGGAGAATRGRQRSSALVHDHGLSLGKLGSDQGGMLSILWA